MATMFVMTVTSEELDNVFKYVSPSVHCLKVQGKVSYLKMLFDCEAIYELVRVECVRCS